MTDRRRRVLHLINGEYFGGSARVLVNYITSAARRSEIQVAVHFSGDLLSRLADLGVPAALLPMRGRFDVAAAREVLRLAQLSDVQLVHTHQVRNSLLARLASLAGGPPVVTHIHSPTFRESTQRTRNVASGLVDRALAWRTRRFITVSKSLANELRRLGISEDRIRVVHNGIPTPDPASAATRQWLRQELAVPAERPIIGMVANFRPRKGTEVLIRASAAARRAGQSIHLLLVGQPFRAGAKDYGAELAALVEQMGIADATTFTGFRADADRVIAGLDAFVLPSLFGEGLPMVLLEAMGAGVPVITTPVEGITEVVEHGRNGLLVPPGDADALAQEIRSLVANRRAASALGAAGRQTVLRWYTSDVMTEGIEAVYDELTGTRAR